MELWLLLLLWYKVWCAQGRCLQMQVSHRTRVPQDHTSHGFQHQQLILLLSQHAAVGEGNQKDTLHFETLGGQLSVQSMLSETNSLPTIQITLPKSDSSMQLPNGLKLSNESLRVCHIPPVLVMQLSTNAVESKCSAACFVL